MKIDPSGSSIGCATIDRFRISDVEPFRPGVNCLTPTVGRSFSFNPPFANNSSRRSTMTLVEQYREQAAEYEARARQETDQFQRAECDRMARAYRRLAVQAQAHAAQNGGHNMQAMVQPQTKVEGKSQGSTGSR
jgi:hypothetical protein